MPSSLSDFPRECTGSPFGDRFLVILGLILMDFDLLSSLRYAKRPTGPSGCASAASAALRRLAMEEPLPARRAWQPSA